MDSGVAGSTLRKLLVARPFDQLAALVLNREVAHFFGLRDDCFAFEIGPLAGEKCDWSAHDVVVFLLKI